MHNLKFRIGSGEATPGGVLAPILAPYGIDLPKFSKELNGLLLARFAKGVPVSVRVQIDSTGYRILPLHPPLSAILLVVPQPVGVVETYNLFRLHLRNRGEEPSIEAARSFFGSIRSFHQWDFSDV